MATPRLAFREVVVKDGGAEIAVALWCREANEGAKDAWRPP
jgi:hypothetical protein